MATQSLIDILFLTFVALQIADAVTTVKILIKGGRELNPVMRWIFDRLGAFNGLAITKAGIILLFYSVKDVMPIWAYVLMIGIYSYVVAHNLVQLKK